MFSTICDLEHDRIAITTTSTRMFTPKPNTCTCVQNMVNIEARWSPGWDIWDTEFSRFPLQGMHKICCHDSVFLIRPTPNTWQYFASYFEYIDFLVCRPYIWSIKCVKEHSNTVVSHCSYGLLGASGSGKTTLLRCVLGRIPIQSGQILILGKPPGARGHSVPGKGVGFMPQVS